MHTWESIDCRDGCSESRSGLLFPILALKSPQINAVSWGWSVSSICSSSVVASVSCIRLLCSDVVGGM